MTEALVLGGGGVAGIAWITGLLTGLAEAGQDVTGADVIVGTSAGSTVAAQLGSGLSLQELYARQVQPGRQAAEIMADVDMESFGAEIAALLGTATTPPRDAAQGGYLRARHRDRARARTARGDRVAAAVASVADPDAENRRRRCRER